MRYNARYPQWTGRVKPTFNSKRRAYWPELVGSTPCSPRNGIIPSVFSGFRPDTLEEGPSKLRLVCRPSRRRRHGFNQLRNFEGGIAAQTPGASVERPRSRRGLFAVTTPCLGSIASPSSYCGQGQNLASRLVLFLARDVSAGLLTDLSPVPVLSSRDVVGACDRSSLSGSPGQGQF